MGVLRFQKALSLPHMRIIFRGLASPGREKSLAKRRKKMTTYHRALDKLNRALDDATASLDKAEALRSDPRTPPDTAFKAEREAFLLLAKAVKQYLALVKEKG